MTSQGSPKLPSEQAFGLLFTIVLAGTGAYRFYQGAAIEAIRPWLAGSLVLALIALIMPRLLAPLNRAWFLLGEFLGKIVSPIVLSLIFFTILTPCAVIGRLFGRDELRLKPPHTESYWLDRTPPGPDRDSFKNLF